MGAGGYFNIFSWLDPNAPASSAPPAPTPTPPISTGYDFALPLTGFQDITSLGPLGPIGPNGATNPPVQIDKSWPTGSIYSSLSFWDRVSGWLWNAGTGTVSPQQKAALEGTETTGIINAGGNPATASQVAHSDVTKVLVLNKADPSQASIFNNPGLDKLLQELGWVVALAGAYFLYRIYLASQGK